MMGVKVSVTGPEAEACDAKEGSREEEWSTGEMTADKPQEVYHYTTGQCFYLIVSDGVIKPATAGVPEGERPAVWFTISPDWDETVNKLYRADDGNIRSLSSEETAELGGGFVRFVVEPKSAPYTWPEFILQSQIDKDMAGALASIADKVGAKVEDWRVAFEPVPRANWLRVDVWDNGEWYPVEVPPEDEAKQ